MTDQGRIMKHIGQVCLACLFFFILLPCQSSISAHAAELQSQVLVQPGSGEMPLLPYLDYYIDETLSMDIEEAAAPGLAASYKPFSLESLPRVEGITWLRFTISPLPPETRPATFLLDMGQSIPGKPTLFDPERNELSGALEWHENFPAHRNILLLPEEGPQPVTCYIKLEGLPGPWFSPVIRTPQNAASNLLGLSRTGAILALAVVMLLCLLRGASEKGQWRIWAGLYVAAALLQGLLGMPETSHNMGMYNLAAVLLPGIALMLLPHVGRHLLDTPRHSRNLDIQLFLLSLPGAALALLPLLPGWHWLDRWIDLWPAATIIFVPTALGAWIGGLTGAKRFLLACLVPPLFTAFAWAGIDFGFPPNFLASLPLWGVAISALLLVTGSSKDRSARNGKKESLPPELSGSGNDQVINLDNPLGDPHLRLVSPPEQNQIQEKQMILPDIPEEKTEELDWLQARENALREPLDEILRQSAALGECSLPPAVRQYAEQMIAAACNMADIMAGTLPVKHDEEEIQDSGQPFNLQHLLRQVHNSVAAGAETTGTALSWYMPPHLCRMFKGNANELKNILSMLLESAVRGSRNGSVHLSARRVPESPDEGHLLFTITDNGAGMPPKDRSTLAIAKTWEMIGRTGGYLALESAPSGVSVALSIRLEPVPEDEEDDEIQRGGLILAGDDPDERRALLKILADLPIRIRQAANMEEVLSAQKAEAVPLLLATGKLARPSSADMTHKFTQLAKKAGYTHSNILAVTPDDSQWELLKPSGFTHAMIRSTDADAIRKTVSDLLRNLVASRSDVTSPPNEKAEPHAREVDGPQTASDQQESDNPWKSTKTNADNSQNVNIESYNQKVSENIEPGKNQEQHFEGPDWLDSIGDNDNRPQDNKSDNSATEHETHLNPDIAKEKVDFTEWVGEPVPVGTPFESHTGNMNPRHEAEDEKPGSQMPETPQGHTSTGENASNDSFLDYVVGVQSNPGAEEIGKTENKGMTQVRNEAGKPVPGTQTENSSMEFELQNAETGNKNGQNLKEIDPLIVELVQKLDQGMEATRQAFNREDCASVANATSEMANTSEKVGLRLLARMARCVERAARANDLPAINDLLPDLETAVERNRIALKQKTGNS